jgi:hypothetical protein
MSPGWPDLTLAKEGHHLIFMELKREQGEVDEDQWFWLVAQQMWCPCYCCATK